jgi:hypothetical protein
MRVGPVTTPYRSLDAIRSASPFEMMMRRQGQAKANDNPVSAERRATENVPTDKRVEGQFLDILA